MFPKLWNSVYINGLPDFQNLMQDYKQNTLLPFLNDALEMSEEWRSMIEQPNRVLSENSQFNALIPEEEKLRKLKENIEFFKKNKAMAQKTLKFLQSSKSNKIYYDTVKSPVKLPSFFLHYIKKIPDHISISTVKLKGKVDDLESYLETWQNQCCRYKESTFNQQAYDHYLLFATTAAHTQDNVNQIINILTKMTTNHRWFWFILLTVGGLLYFNVFTCLKTLIFNSTNFINA